MVRVRVRVWVWVGVRVRVRVRVRVGVRIGMWDRVIGEGGRQGGPTQSTLG